MVFCIITNSELNMGAKLSADLSTLFDIGGIFGGILAGHISDVTGMSALTCGGSFILTIPFVLSKECYISFTHHCTSMCFQLYLYRLYGSLSTELNVFLLFVVGLLANGPYALITTAVSADLGTHPDLKGSTCALATVSSFCS